jgi:hypothetical protein
MIINDTQDGYVIFLDQKEIDRIVGWIDGWYDEHHPDELDKSMELKLRPKLRGSRGYDENKKLSAT